MNIRQKQGIFFYYSCDYNTFSFYILRTWWEGKNYLFTQFPLSIHKTRTLLRICDGNSTFPWDVPGSRPFWRYRESVGNTTGKSGAFVDCEALIMSDMQPTEEPLPCIFLLVLSRLYLTHFTYPHPLHPLPRSYIFPSRPFLTRSIK